MFLFGFIVLLLKRGPSPLPKSILKIFPRTGPRIPSLTLPPPPFSPYMHLLLWENIIWSRTWETEKIVRHAITIVLVIMWDFERAAKWLFNWTFSNMRISYLDWQTKNIFHNCLDILLITENCWNFWPIFKIHILNCFTDV